MGELRRYAAANARVRVLLGGLLGRSGLEALSGYPSAAAMLDALSRSPYGAALAAGGVADGALLRRLTASGRALLGAVSGPARHLLRQYLLRYEVENLKVIVRAVGRRLPWERIADWVVDLRGIATVDPAQLVEAADLRALTERLADSAYGPALRAAWPHLGELGPFALEVAIELDQYDRLWAAATALPTTDRRRACDLLGVLFDVLNLAWIARYRDALALSAEEIINYTLQHGRWVNGALRRALAEATAPSWVEVLAGTPYAALLAERAANGEVRWSELWRYLATHAQRAFTGYPFHIGVPLAFLLVQEIEIRDLQVLLAAKRMGLGAARILGQLASLRP